MEEKQLGIRSGRKKRLGDLLVDAGVITEDKLMEALKEQKTRKERLGILLTDMGITTEREIVNALKVQLGIESVILSEIVIPEDILGLVEQEILKKYMLIPFAFSEKNPNILKVAMSDPLDIRAVDDLMIITNLQIEPVVATSREVAAAIDRYYGNKEAMKVAEEYQREHLERFQKKEQDDLMDDEISQAPIVRLVTQIIEQAVHKRASDIHIEAMENEIRIRFRIDGVLQEAMRHNINLLPAVVARIKIIGGMDISEKRKPQDGRTTSVVDRNQYDVRISTLPTVYGEKVVMRIASKQMLERNKKELGFTEEELVRFNAILEHPHGIILVTGPTGSGKSTTLYTALSELNGEGVNIITVEDPVEANIKGVNQVQVNPKANLTFASALRSILRQDPDIIMIGEIRDSETAEIAVKASITGHLVVSTLHTNSAASTITRLQDMGVESYLLADSLAGIIAQRLYRKICMNCSTEREATQEEKKLLDIEPHQVVKIRQPNQCSCLRCNGTGYYGRSAVYEIMTVTPKIKEAINNHWSAAEIRDIALQERMDTLELGMKKNVLNGRTSIEEMKRITYGE